jgi:O-antigen ligase
MTLALAGTVITGLTVFVAPELTEPFVHRNVYKYTDEDQGVFYTRDQPWEDSYNAATEGAWIGLGYGVSAGEYNFDVGLSAVGYGREKGNSQLAIVEETGIVGLILYVALLFALFPELVGAFRACRIAEHRMMMGLLIGTLSGMVLQSVFEAWWVAPGAPEFAYFWAIAGAALGAARMIRDQSVAQVVRVSTALYPVSA